MSFPACRHARRKNPASLLPWLAAEPFRLFFLSGALWSAIGVSLWPLFYAGKLGFYPGITHARLMIEVFGGAFAAGFLGTAGPRMATAPKLTTAELLVLFALHTAGGLLHLRLQIRAADACFAAMLSLLLLGLSVRIIRFRKETPPPQLLLALTGLVCGIAGSVMWLNPEWITTAAHYRMAGLLVYQGLLLPPVLGIGSFLFPRILGGAFGEPETPEARRSSLIRAAGTAVLTVGSFFLETAGHPAPAYLLRAGVAALYLGIEVRWRRRPEDPPRGTLSRNLPWALVSGFTGLTAAGFFYPQRTGLEHLLYIGTFGFLILIVASRVLFGHSGDLAGFSRRTATARILTALALLAATTRASAEIWPKITVSHHKYAAWLWAAACLLWIVWHRRRFFRRDDS